MTQNTGITVNGVKLTVAGFHELKQTLKFRSFCQHWRCCKDFKTQHDRNKDNVPGFAGVLAYTTSTLLKANIRKLQIDSLNPWVSKASELSEERSRSKKRLLLVV